MDAPLQAFTESGLASSKSKTKSNFSAKSKSSSGREGNRRSAAPPRRSANASSSSVSLRKRPKRVKASSNIPFDEAARHEYLTGFRKRKQERIEKARANALKRAKEEAKAARKEAKEAKKDKARENVKMERLALGLASEEDEEDEEEDGEDDANQEQEMSGGAVEVSSYETPEHLTSVTVSEWDPTADPAEEEARLARAAEAAASARVATLAPKLRTVDELPASSRRMAKKSQSLLKKEQESARSRSVKHTREIKGKRGASSAAVEAAASISALVEQDVPRIGSDASSYTDPILGGGGSKPFLAGKQRAQQSYTTAAERKAQNEKLKMKRKRHMEERKEKEKRILQNGGSSALALKKRGTGKMGKGGKGKDLRKRRKSTTSSAS